MTFSDRLKLMQIYLSSGALRSVRLLNRNPLQRLRLSGSANLELLIAPQDITTADPTLANDIYSGYFPLGGHAIDCGGTSPFQMENTPLAWQKALHEFGWLKHMRAAETSIATTQSQLLVADWIKLHGNLKGLPGQVEHTARRVIAWLCHSPLILKDCDVDYYKKVIRSLSKQVKFLRIHANEQPAGMPRMMVALALAYAAICMSGSQSFLKNATRRLDQELKTQVLADGGHISRNPRAVVTILSLLLPLRQAVLARELVPSDAMIGAIDRLMPMLRFFRMGDGNFGQFNGMGDTPKDVIGTMLAFDDSNGAPVLNASQSGYQRLMAGDVTVLVDAGPSPKQVLSAQSHAGCLSLEMSVGVDPLVINCGHIDDFMTPETELLSRISRITAAHSTLTISEESSARFMNPGALAGLGGIPVLSGPKRVDVDRSRVDASTVLHAEHDGYVAMFGLKHQRTLVLPDDQRSFSGRDAVLTTRGKPVADNSKHTFQVRFHLHPSVNAVSSSTRMIELTLGSGKRWIFVCENADVKLDETMIFSDVFGTRKAIQIVIEGALQDVSAVDWSFQRLS